MNGALHHEDLGPFRVLRVEGERVWAGRGLELHRSEDGGRRFRRVAAVPGRPAQRMLSHARLAARLLRIGLHALEPLPSGALLATIRGAIVRLDPGSRRFETALVVERGRRPLNLCASRSGAVYFGEYWRNRERAAVRVFATEDGRAWDVVHTFPAGSVRHVHGIFHDPFRGGEWVLTGDRAEECGLWFTPDGFRTLEPVVRGAQRARAVSVLPTPDALVVPMDSPLERNWIQLLDPASGRLEPVAELPGSSFHSGRAGELLLVSTAVERSRVNPAQHVSLFASRDGERWCEVTRLARDLPLLRNAPPVFQWPTLVLPSGPGSPDHVLATGQALRGLHGALLRFPAEEIRARLAPPAPSSRRLAS